MFQRLWYEPLETKDVKGFVHDLHFFLIVDGVNLDLAKAAGRIICEGRHVTILKSFESLP